MGANADQQLCVAIGDLDGLDDARSVSRTSGESRKCGRSPAAHSRCPFQRSRYRHVTPALWKFMLFCLANEMILRHLVSSTLML